MRFQSKIWPKNKVLGARVNGSDWMEKGTSISDCIFLCQNLKKIGFNYVCVSSGGVVPKTKIMDFFLYETKM